MNMSTDYDARFNRVYEQVFPVLVRIVFRMTGDEATAEEITQESFIKYYERRNIFPTDNDARYWLIRVAKNTALNHEKRKGREKKAYDKVLQLPKRPEESTEVEMMKDETQVLVQKALEKLPENLRSVIILKEYSDMNYEEIGKVLGISEGNVKVRVFRARAQLAKLLEKGDVYVP